jgi:hypothetical protein
MYGAAIPTTLRQIVIPCVPGASNCAGTVAGTITSNQVAFGCGVNTICGSNSILWTASGNSGTFLLANTTPATNLANQNSPLLIVQGSEWNGASAVNDTWTIQNILGAGSNTTSTLVFSHAGAPINGVTTLFPGAVNTGIASGVSGSFGMFGAASGFAGWTVSGVAGSPHLISMPTADPAQSGYLLAGFVGNPTGTLWIPPSVFMYCGATSGATQNCTQTVQSAPLTVHGDVTLNTATTQSIGNLPFTAATYSCSGSDLTTVTGIVNFNTYANGSVVISESGGTNTDHLRYICVGN